MKRPPALSVLVIALAGLSMNCKDDSASPRFTAEESFSLGSDVTTQTAFRLEGINGEIEVTGSDTATQVTATGFRRITADTQQEADDALPDLQVEMTSTTEEVLLKTLQPKNSAGKNYEVEYVIVLPQNLAITLLNANGSITVDGANAGLIISIANGSITTRNILDDATLAVANGRIDAQVTLLSGSVVRAGTSNGNLRLEVPTQTSAEVTAAVGNGEITTTGLVFTDLITGGSSLSGRLGSGDGTIDLSTGNGSIDLIGK